MFICLISTAKKSEPFYIEWMIYSEVISIICAWTLHMNAKQEIVFSLSSTLRDRFLDLICNRSSVFFISLEEDIASWVLQEIFRVS